MKEDLFLSGYQEYYLKIYSRWLRESTYIEQNTENEYFKTLNEIDLNDEIFMIIDGNFIPSNLYFKAANIDRKINIISAPILGFRDPILGSSEITNIPKMRLDFGSLFFGKKIIIYKGSVSITSATGHLDIINFGNSKNTLVIRKSDLESAKIENFDLNMLNVNSRKNLLKLWKDGKAEFLNCKFDALDLEILRGELEQIKSLPKEPQEIFDFTDKVPKVYWDALATYFSGFKGHVKRGFDKEIGLEISVKDDFVVKVFSENANDLETIEQDLKNYLLAIPNFINNQMNSVQTILSGGTIDPNIAILQGMVSNLSLQINYQNLQLESKDNHIKILQTSNDTLLNLTTNLQESVTIQFKENQKLLMTTNPKIYTEGKIDVAYLVKAIEVLGYTNLNQIEIEQIGYEDGKNVKESGCNGLNNYLRSNKYKTDLLSNKVLLLYDCDVKVENQNINDKLYTYHLPFNNSNQSYKIGIENLLPQNLFKDERYWEVKKIVDINTGKTTTIEDLNKTKLCEDICERGVTTDFENFKPLLNYLSTIFL